MEDSHQPADLAPPRRGWWSRNWLWFVPTLCLAMFLLCGGLCAGVIFWGLATARQLEPYQMALKQVQSDPQVIERLGKPIEDATFFPTVQLDVENDQGDVILGFKVTGPNGKADVRTQARLIGGSWGLTTLDVTFSDGERVSLPIEGEAGLDEAPPWSPDDTPQSSPEAGSLDWSPDSMPAMPENLAPPADK